MTRLTAHDVYELLNAARCSNTTPEQLQQLVDHVDQLHDELRQYRTAAHLATYTNRARGLGQLRALLAGDAVRLPETSTVWCTNVAAHGGYVHHATPECTDPHYTGDHAPRAVPAIDVQQ